MPAERREAPEIESAAVVGERANEALVNRQAALAAASWAGRSGATTDELLEMMQALGIDLNALRAQASESVINLP